MSTDPQSESCLAAYQTYCAGINQGLTVGVQDVTATGPSIVCSPVAVGRRTTFSALNAQLGRNGCEVADSQSAGCRAAASRFCTTAGLAGGLLVYHEAPETAAVNCLPPEFAAREAANYTVLKFHDAACDILGGRPSNGIDCSVAASRYCRSRGFVGSTPVLETTLVMGMFHCLSNTDVTAQYLTDVDTFSYILPPASDTTDLAYAEGQNGLELHVQRKATAVYPKSNQYRFVKYGSDGYLFAGYSWDANFLYLGFDNTAPKVMIFPTPSPLVKKVARMGSFLENKQEMNLFNPPTTFSPTTVQDCSAANLYGHVLMHKATKIEWAGTNAPGYEDAAADILIVGSAGYIPANGTTKIVEERDFYQKGVGIVKWISTFDDGISNDPSMHGGRFLPVSGPQPAKTVRENMTCGTF